MGEFDTATSLALNTKPFNVNRLIVQLLMRIPKVTYILPYENNSVAFRKLGIIIL